MVSYLKFVLVLSVVFAIVGCIGDNHKKIIVEDSEGYFREEYFVLNDSIKDGKYLRYYANGKLSDSCGYINGKLEGVRKVFSEKGFLEISETYKNDILDGDYIVYYPNGNIKVKQYFSDNVLSDYSYGYYQDGQLKEKVNIEDGIENGPFVEYYPSGKLHWKGTYLKGDNEHDTLYEYNIEGELVRKLFCKMGMCNTVWRLNEGKVSPNPDAKVDDALLEKIIDN